MSNMIFPSQVLFGTPIYERALQLCWHSPSYKSMIALMTQLLRLQQNNQLPAEVTAANMSELLVEQSKETLRVQLWEFELEGYDDDVRPLLQLVWEVNNAMKMRDVEYEARRLLSSPEAVPPRFQHPNIISQALEYAVILKEQQEKGPRSELLSPMEVVLQVLPKVLQGFWMPPPNTCFSMPSQQLSPMAVGITKAVQDRVSKTLSTVLLQATFSSTTRDNMTLSIQEKVRQGYSQDVLEKGLNSFAAEVLNTITDVAVREVCALFQPLISEAVETATDEPPASPEPDSAVGSTPCALTVTDEPPASPEPDSAVGSTPCALTVTDEPPASPEPDSAAGSTPCALTVTDEPPASPEPDSAAGSTPCALTVTDEPPASPEPDSAAGSTPCALTVTDEPPASPEPDSAAGSTPCALSVTDEPPASPEPDSAAGSTPCALTVTDEPPASPEPDSAVGSTPCALTVTDEPPASPEPDSAVGSTPCALTVTDEPPASPEPDSAVGSTPCALTVTDEPPASPEPDSAVGSTPCALTVTDEPQKPVYSFVNYNYNAEARGTNSTENEAPGLQENREMISAIITTPPALSAHTAIQNVFNRSLGETDRHEESESVEVSTFSAVKKSKFRGFLNWLKKHCCCCLLSGDNEVD
ncbi:hypothetical protein GBF38_019725 [Nibea albiflora]|uniref:Uncharacterized protein n=1 Tax=Nibea albiflora TaxID=240163 RepID=A0ACB7F202_NIBAL|nr:hypothetical protein GBF38_019725 [Nibea albiflora]